MAKQTQNDIDNSAEIKILDNLLIDLYAQKSIVESSIEKAEKRKKDLLPVSTDGSLKHPLMTAAMMKVIGNYHKDKAKQTKNRTS